MKSTALQIIQQAALELGLNKPNEVSASLENTGQQMLALLNAAGSDLSVMFPWQEISAVYAFQTVAAQAAYSFPANMNYVIDETFWDLSNHWPVLGPLTAQEWAAVTADVGSIAGREVFRFIGDRLVLFPTPASVTNMSYEYVTADWVEDGLNLGSYKTAVTADADIPRLNSNLLVKALKVKMWGAKGLDTTALLGEFQLLYEALIGKNKGAKTLSLTARSGSSLLSGCNTPASDWAV
jgi:hypothetical protein